ncbi:hypothetical protein QYF61_017875 [Mycteria americana]|uniref:Uncharacterized protein n=1 Tax=Mycteria americana TaxID=33587 RepID=A0AAN7MVT5_MYCAM|nr:hypothetical protein QYF61_017875 [Mycteria americana]
MAKRSEPAATSRCNAQSALLPLGERQCLGAPGAVEQRDQGRTLGGGGVGYGTLTLALHESRGLAGCTHKELPHVRVGTLSMTFGRSQQWERFLVTGRKQMRLPPPPPPKNKEEELGNCWPDSLTSILGKGMEQLTWEAISRGDQGQDGDQESVWICEGQVMHPQPDHLLL